VNGVTHRIRWHVKKLARSSMALLSWGTGWLALRRRLDRTPAVRVLTYHRFRRCDRDPFSVDVDQFERQMRWLASRRLAISLRDVQAFVSGAGTVPDGAVLVTIDDGFRDTHSGALPILRELGIPAVVFVPTADVVDHVPIVRATADATDDDLRLSRAEIAELQASAIDIESHSHDHVSLAGLETDQIKCQLGTSKDLLETLLGHRVRAFAYPFGTRRDFNDVTTRLVAEAGYRLAFTSQHGAIRADANPHVLPRIKVEGGEALWLFKLLVAGGLDLWGVVDRTLWWLQQSKAARATN
jgi:peptidoglycan/xylan/chitin deacetylase (PgdA/CDA1 family)